jgi:hypothetical protein
MKCSAAGFGVPRNRGECMLVAYLALSVWAVSAFAQAPTIRMKATPSAVLVGEHLTITIFVDSRVLWPAEAIVYLLPPSMRFVSARSSNSRARCIGKTGWVPPLDGYPSLIRGSYVYCPVLSLGAETVTVIVYPTTTGTFTNGAAVGWQNPKRGPYRSGQIAAASAVVTVTAPTTVFANFGPASSCQAGTPDNCINQNAIAVNGDQQQFFPFPEPAETVAASFTPNADFSLADVQVPVAFNDGTNTFNVWITQDAAGIPGPVMEALGPASVPADTLPPFTTVTTIRSKTFPALKSGTQYWIVIGPGAPDSYASWLFSWYDNATNANALLNSSTSYGTVPASSWTGFGTLGFPLRPAFQIDGVLQ